MQATPSSLLHSWSHQTASVLFGLAAAGIACGAVAKAAEERLNPGTPLTCYYSKQGNFFLGPDTCFVDGCTAHNTSTSCICSHQTVAYAFLTHRATGELLCHNYTSQHHEYSTCEAASNVTFHHVQRCLKIWHTIW